LASFGSTILRKNLDEVPLWRGEQVSVRQLVEDFARYLYLPRLAGPEVLLQTIRDGVALLTWQSETFGFAEGYDEAAGRYRGLRGGSMASVSAESSALLVRPDVARRQMEADAAASTGASTSGRVAVGAFAAAGSSDATFQGQATASMPAPQPMARRFHGTVDLDPARVGRDASRIADEVIAHLSGLVGAEVRVTLEIAAEIPSGAPDQIVRTVTENSRTLKFTTQGFERE
jgi:hypothetical protein